MVEQHNRFWYYLKKRFALFPLADPGRPQVFEAATGLHGFYQRIWDQAGPLQRLLFRAQKLAFRAWLPGRLREMAKKHGLSAEDARAVGALARLRWYDPRDLIVNEIRDEAGCDRLVRRFEEAAVVRRLNPQYFDGTCEMDDKIRFAARCAAAGLPHPPLRAICRGGVVEARSLPETPEMFVKPVFGTGGFGAQIVRPEGAGDEGALRALLQARAGTRIDWLAQDRLRNHPVVEAFALQALSTMRIVTIMNEELAPELVAAALKIAVDPEAIVDNAGAADGLRVEVDLETATLGRGAAKGSSTHYTANPGNGARFEGRRIPFAAEAAALVRRAHETAFPDYVYAGWDVALTAEGPVLIEGNAKATMTSAQRPGLTIMGAERFQTLLAHNLARGDLRHRKPAL